MSPISKSKPALQSMLSKVHNPKHNLFTQRRTPEGLAELPKEIQLASNLTPMQQAVEDTLGYGGRISHRERFPPPEDNSSAASIRTITSQCADNPRWECERLAAFLRARNVAYDGSNTSVVMLARSNDPWKLERENAGHAVLMQVAGSLIIAFARYAPEEISPSSTSRLTASNVSQFSAHNNLDAGLAILSALPPLDLDGKGLFLIVDLSEVSVSEDGPSSDHRNLMKALNKIAVLNRAILIRMEATKTGSDCFIHGPGGTNQDGSKDLQVIYDSTEDEQ
ncbi:hypothetical protein F5B21DRAFT_502983 [Xylaria acuta]|nr:hypothetical protein F5B21DRAFT_502983 [Xylaria acuta]